MEQVNRSDSFMHARDTKHLFALVLQRSIDAGRLTIDQLADVTGVSGSTVRRWVVAEQLPDLHEIRQLAVSQQIDLDIRLELLSVATTGSPFRIESSEASGALPELVHSAMQSVVGSAEVAKHVVESAADKMIDHAEAAVGLAKCHAVQTNLDSVRTVFERHAVSGVRGPRAVG
jgi:hypothetical protein